MPFPSRGCRTCRQRHLQCDETRPICARCTRSSRVCLGFESGKDSLPFRSENAYASGVARRPRRAKANEWRKAVPRSDTSQWNQDTALEQIPRTLDIPLEDVALNYYLQSHMFAAEHLPLAVQGWFEQTIRIKRDADTDSLLGSIVSAVSLATFGRTKVSTEALVLGSRKYLRALAKIKTAVGNPDEATTDQFLVTVMMLGVYEHAVSRYSKNFLLAESFRHQNGAITLLRLRKAKYKAPAPLDMLVRRTIIKQAVVHAAALPEWIWDGAEFGEEEVQAGLDTCLVRLALLRKRVQELWRGAQVSNEVIHEPELRKVIAEALDIDRELARWAAGLPREWIYTIQGESSPSHDCLHTIEGDPERIQYGSTISLYPNLQEAATWNRYRASRIVAGCIVVKAIAYALANLPDNHEPDGRSNLLLSKQLAARGNVQRFVDEICASVPYHFDVLGSNSDLPKDGKPRLDQVGVRRAYLLSWPLTICMAATGVSEHQRRWVRSRVLDVSKITGNRALELVANMEQNITFHGDSHSMSQQREKESMKLIRSSST